MPEFPPSASSAAPSIVWFRNDLRLDDNPALAKVAANGSPVVALYVFDQSGERPLGGASLWWLHHALAALQTSLSDLKVPLLLRVGSADDVVPSVVADIGAASVYWNRRYTAGGITQDAAIKAHLKAEDIEAESFNANLLYEPWALKTGAGGPYRVFTPFSRAARASGTPNQPTRAPKAIQAWSGTADTLELSDLNFLPTHPDWAGGLREAWAPGTDGARANLASFVADKLSGYPDDRNVPGMEATTRLSPHLRFGEISPREVWHAAEIADAPRDSIFKFHQELLWREFSYHLLYHYPDLGSENHQSKFDDFPWLDHTSGKGAEHLKAWHHGQTGYPIVDAGMRELWHTGYMHNRVRMIVGSFLVKHLLIDWRAGEAWFWDTLVDADPANNTASWQWIAGSGADAAPYFRIFNPVLQGEKFDGDGAYTRRWVPEVSKLPKKYLHKPWEAPTTVLREAGMTLGSTYPHPIVDHKSARDRALQAFKSLSDTSNAA
ncbi:MAG: cryptochrome/photolyase family protein [Hyphomicrobiales bacterium]